MRRRHWLGASAALLAAPRLAPAAARDNTLRVAFRVAETGFDPVAIGDENSNRVAACIFESPLTYDHLARPVAMQPLTAEALPEVADDFRSFTFRIRPGIFFADDPVFQGRPRELVAQDYVYAIKRYYDPRNNSELLYLWENAGVLGLTELRERALKEKKPFDYDATVEGIRALDRYTFSVRLAKPGPRFAFLFAQTGLAGAIAREVVEAYGADIAAHPVGTGPYVLAAWRRSSRIELVRNPRYRERIFEATPAPGDAQAQAIARALAGRRLPLAERVEISVIEESQPRWLAFLDGSLDQIELPVDFAPVAVPGGALAPHLARRGVRLQRVPQPDMVMTYFNMLHPLVGGYAPEKVALRRAIALAYDNDEELRALRNGQGIAAQSTIPPFTSGYESGYRSEMSAHDPARAMALLDLYGYLDRNGDGWRELPDGSPLVLRLSSTSSQISRRGNELWRKHLARVGLRIEFDVATWPDLLKRSRNATLMMWGYGWVAQSPDGGFFLGIAYGPNSGESNDARFALPAFDRLFERQSVLPDGAERLALMREGKNMLAAHMPYKAHVHTITNDLLQPRVRGWWRHPFARDTWVYTGVDMETSS
ncbi:MAG: bicyclomycin resistance protein [Piscinibacter sp.]|uniref:ABC transporter substrate-binding protein n=1 Tax=Piscinibacter sp. TaxID=1903157 RepID=UPI001B5FC52F|nr:ABC transporter substrate-binding protein [Piscinibacter sp.]MBP5991509.1 bicyclomycin resistance protein [Piscinibacter sp.]MBP6028722.1 bicyclomycin resistance protein [Piscinibacter sp.]